jgi:hypothetical protein
MESNLNSVVEKAKTVTVTEADIHRTLDDQPVKAHKSKKYVKDRNKAGRASMAPPSLDPPSKHARHDIAEGAPQSVPGRNTPCTATYPVENQRPTSRSIDQQGDDWRVNDGTYDGAYDNSYHTANNLGGSAIDQAPASLIATNVMLGCLWNMDVD